MEEKERNVSELNDKSNIAWVRNIKYHFIQYITLWKLLTNMHSNFTKNSAVAEIFPFKDILLYFVF